VRGQLALRRAGVAREEREHPAFEVRQLARPVAHRAVLARAEQVHHGMDGLDHVVAGHLVDKVNGFAHDG